MLAALSFTPFLLEGWIGGQTSALVVFCLALAIYLRQTAPRVLRRDGARHPGVQAHLPAFVCANAGDHAFFSRAAWRYRGWAGTFRCFSMGRWLGRLSAIPAVPCRLRRGRASCPRNSEVVEIPGSSFCGIPDLPPSFLVVVRGACGIDCRRSGAVVANLAAFDRLASCLGLCPDLDAGAQPALRHL